MLSIIIVYFSNIKNKPKGGKKSKGGEECSDDLEDSDDEDEFNEMDEEVVSLGSMDEEFGDDIDEEGGAFMNVSDDDNSPGKVMKTTVRSILLKMWLHRLGV